MNRKENVSLKDTICIIGKALKISLKIKTASSYLTILIGFVVSFFPLLIANCLGKMTDSLLKLQNGTISIVVPLKLFAIIGGILIVQAINTYIQNYIAKRDMMNIEAYLKETIIKITCRVKYKYIENYDEFRQKIDMFESKTGYEVATSINIIIRWLQNLVTFTAITVSLLKVNVWIVVVLMAACIPAFIICYQQKDEEYRFKTKWMKEGSMVIHYYGMCCAPDSMNELRHWNIYNYMKSGWKDIAHTYVKKKNEITKKHVLYNSIGDFLRSGVYIVILIIVTNEIFHNPSIGLGTYMLVTSLSSDYQRVTIELFTQIGLFLQDIKYMKDFFYLCDIYQDIESDANTQINSWDIDIENINFTYPNSDRKVLDQINLHFKEGEKIAIVGENGSGKTTLINLLCGLEEPDSGEIKFGNQNLKNGIKYVREHLSVVFQNFSKYEDTIRENITISMHDQTVNETNFEEICKKTGVQEIAKQQKEGYEEIVGIFSEDGNNLSGGQWQKIALARAAYKDNAKVMILDEPTAALDPVAEAKLYETFTDIVKDKTVILISHRLGICKFVDRIIVMREGRIIENGSHRELMEHQGYYSELYKSQAQWYA